MKKTLIESSKCRQKFNFKELWSYRELLWFLVWRNLKVRYSQTIVGVLWVVIQPVVTMLIFSILFGKFAKLPSEGIPYAIFVFSALLPWNLFASAINGAGTSLVMNRNLITKIYFPRILVPLAKIIESMVDFCISCGILMCLMFFYKITPNAALLTLPIFVLWTIALSFGIGLLFSALNIKYRDITHAIPFLVQIWLYITPVAYTLGIIPRRWHLLYALNPMVGIVEGFRWSLLGRGVSLPVVLPVSLIMTSFFLIIGYIYFSNTESMFADII